MKTKILSCLQALKEATGLKPRDDSDFINLALEALSGDLSEQNWPGKLRLPDSLHKYIPYGPPALYQIELEKDTDAQSAIDEVRGKFILKNTATEITDEIDFSATVAPHEEFGDRAVAITMPELEGNGFSFPYYASRPEYRMELTHVLKMEAEKRTGLDASLKLNAF